MSTKPQILVVHPSVKLATRDYARLSKVGFLIVRGEAKDFALLDATALANATGMLKAALRAMNKATSRNPSYVGEHFARELARELAPEAPHE
jgi:hypothetical protein